MSMRTEDFTKSAVTRITAAAREYITESYFNQRKTKPWIEFPAIPDFADLRDELKPYIEREILQAILDRMIAATAKEVFDLVFELNEINWEIANRENAKRGNWPSGQPHQLPPYRDKG